MYSYRKDPIHTRDPEIKSIQDCAGSKRDNFCMLFFNRNKARIIIKTDKRQGASTGPSQGKGMRNKMSHSRIETGQLRTNFNPI
jgi:hypothetical protein